MGGGEILPKYTGPLARLMRAEEAAGILRTIEAILPVAQASGDMKVLRRINADQAVKVIGAVREGRTDCSLGSASGSDGNLSHV
jgi:hypothetical protein